MGGIFRGEGTGDSLRFRRVTGRSRADAAWIDPSGRIWFAMRDSLLLYDEGRFLDRSRPRRSTVNAIVAFAQGAGREIIVAERRALYRFDPERGAAEAWTEIPVRLEPGQDIYSVATDASGAVWVGTRRGLIRLSNGEQRLYSRRQGLSNEFIRALEIDREGNLWIGTDALGVCEIAGEEVVTYTAAGRTSGPSLVQTVVGRDGRIYATTDECGAVELRDGELTPVPGAGATPFSNLNYRLACDREGDWWAGTDLGLFKLEGPELQFERARRFGPESGLPDGFVLGLWYEAQTDTLWVGLAQGGLYAAAIAPGRSPVFRRVGGEEAPGFEPRCVRRDRTGSLWVTGFIGIARMRHGRVDRMRTGEGLPDDQARCVFADSRGWVWLGLRNRGVSVTSDPLASTPGWRNESIATGLSSNTVWSIAEDGRGRIYFGTGRGLDRLDPAANRIRHLGTIDGLAGETVNHCLSAPDGMIWLATSGGLTRIDPRAGDAPAAPPQTYFSRVEVAGVELPLPGRGVTRIDPQRFPSGTDNLRIEYVCLHFGRPNTMRYATFLEGADRDWGPDTEERAINYAHLAPGSYRLSVRAVRPEDGGVGEAAHFDFTIMPPLWARAWFIVAAAAALIGLGLLTHRYRLRQAVAMERIRRQIAADLHDDIGSGLAQIAVLSEVAKRGTSGITASTLDRTAELARSMRESMGDIVWSIDPRRDHLHDLVLRMRQVSAELLELRGVAVTFHVPTPRASDLLRLAPDRRRHLFLVFKEAVANVARHADARRAEVAIELRSGRLVLSICDDGRGFDPQQEVQGHGLKGMRHRAAEMGARLEVDTSPGEGTTIRVEMDLGRKRGWSPA
jgi:signal transduction histidine kinase/ligand-binding sensor domain-containing protein